MKKVLKGKILYFSVFFAILFGFVFAFIANSPNVYAANDEEITSAKLDGNVNYGTDGRSSGNWSWSGGIKYQSSYPASEAHIAGQDRVLYLELNAGGGAVTFTYNNSITQYKISKVEVCFSVISNAQATSVSAKYGSTAATEDEWNNNVMTYLMGKTTDDISITFTGINNGDRTSIICVGYIKLYQEAMPKPVTIAAGTGVKSVYLSTTKTATSGSDSGTGFESGATVYGFAELAKGYKAKTGWSHVSGTENTEGAIYCVGSVTAGSKNFGEISADFATYTITYNLNNGTVEGENPTSYDMNSEDITLINPTRKGYTFKGWSGNDLTGDENEDVTIPTGSVGDRTYTANWTGNTYNVILNKNGGTINGEEVTQYVVGEGAILPTDVTKDNFVFIGWYDNEEFTGSPITEILDTDINDKKYFARFAIVENDGEYFTTLADAIEKAHEGDAIKLLIDLNLSDSLTILKSITIDLNGHILNIPYISSQAYTVWVSEKSTVTIDDTSSNVGGVKGTFGVQSGSYIALKHGRFDIFKENILAKTNLYKVADNILLLNCNDGNPDEDGFLTLARLITDQDYANEAIALINAIGSVTYPESKELIDAARKAYDGLTEDQRALVSNYVTLQTAESNYATLENEYYANEVIALIDEIGTVTYPDSKESIDAARKAYDGLKTDEQKNLVTNYETLESAESKYDELEVSYLKTLVASLPDVDAVLLDNKKDVLTAKEIYDNLKDSIKETIENTIVTKIEQLVAKLNELVECTHNLIKIEINEVKNTSNKSRQSISYSSNYKNNDILPGSTGVDIGFIGGKSTTCPTGHAIVTATVELDEARTVYFYWYNNAQVSYARTKVSITVNDEETIVYDFSNKDDCSWHTEEINCQAGLNTIVFRYDVSDGSQYWADETGRYFKLLPEVISHFDEDSKCSVCGIVCTHETIGMGYDETKDEYFFRCFDLCAHKVDLNELSHENKSIVESARAAYDKLTDEQKEKVPADVLKSLLKAEEDYKNYVYGENWAAASNVISMINNLPDASSITLVSKADVLDARTAYNALTSEQKALIENEDELLTKLTTLESKIPVLEVEALINAIPAVDAITYASEDAIKAARTAYNALSAAQKAEISEEILAKLTNAETKFSSLFVDDVIALIDAIPAVDAITYDSKDAIDAARKAYNALSATQKEEVSEEKLTKLTASEEKYNNLIVDSVVALIEALPEVSELVFDDKSKIEQARAAYNSLTTDQRKLLASEHTTKLSNLETKLREISWVDYSLPFGTYKFVSGTDETKALIHIDNRTVHVGVYDDNNRHYKWKTVPWKNSPLHEIYNIFDPYANERLLDSNGWSLSDGNGIGFVRVDHTKSEYETDLFRFSKRMGVVMEEDEYYIRIVKGTAYDFVLTLRSDTKVNIGAYSKGSLNQVWKVVRVKGDEDYADEVEEKIKLLPESYDATTLVDEEIVNDAKKAYDNLTKYQKTLVSKERTKQLEDANQKIVDIKAANAFIQKMNAIGVVTYDEETLTRIHAARDTYNALTDAQKNLASDITILTDAEKAYAELADAAINELLDSIEGEITLEDKETILAAKAKYDELSKEEKEYIKTETFDKLSAALVSLDILLLPEVGVLVLTDKPKVVAAREEYDALTEKGKALVSQNILNVLVAAETEIKDIEAAKAVDDLINALPNLANLTINHATAVSAARAAYEELSNYQKGKVTKSCLDKLIVAEAIIEVLKLPAFDDLALDDEALVVNVNAIIEGLGDQKALVPQAILDILKSLNTKIADMKVAKGIDDLIDAIGEVEYTDASKAKIDNARSEYNAITEVQQTYVKHLDTLINAEKAYAALAEKEISDLLDLKVEDITISDKDKISKAKQIYDGLTKEEKLHLSDKIIDKILASSVTLAVIDLPNTDEITLAHKDAIEAVKALYNELTEEQQQTLLPNAIVDKYFAVVTILDILELTNEPITVSDKDKVEAVRASYDALTDAQKALVPQTVLDKLIASEVSLVILELPEVDKITVNNKDVIEAARTSFAALTEEQKALVPQTVLDKLVASEAVLKILELPVGADITQNDKDAIEAARTSYNKLTDEQKALVPQIVLDKLIASESVLEILLLPASGELTIEDDTIVEAARIGYEALTAAQKLLVPQTVLDKLVASEACLVILGLPAYDEIESSHDTLVEDARDAYAALTKEQQALVAQSVLDKLIVSELVIKGLSILPAANVDTDITQSDKEAIEKAYDMYSKLSEQQLELVPEAISNKILSSMAILSLITLPNLNTLTVADEKIVDTAFSVYNQLTEAQKDLMPEDSVNNVYAANAIMAILKLHDSENLELTDETDIIAARALYDTLTKDQKLLVPQTVLDKLVSIEIALGIIKLPALDKITANDDTIISVRDAYDELTENQKKLIHQDIVNKLVTEVITLDIVKLSNLEAIDSTFRTDIEAARASYENLTNAQKQLVLPQTLNILVASEAVLEIEELPVGADIKTTNKDAIVAARTTYNKLTDAQKALIPQTVLDKLVASEAILAIVSLKDISEIDDTVSEEDINAIKAAKALYDKLTDAQKALVPQDNVDKILTLSTTIEAITLPKCENITLDDADEIKALKEQYDELTDEEKKMISSDFVDKIYAADAIITVLELDDTDDISSDDKDAIVAARGTFDNLTKDQLALVPKNIVDALIASEAVLEIVELPDGADIKPTDKDAIEAARAAYKALDEDQEELVPQSKINKLIASEAILEIVELPFGADIEETDKDAIVAARNTYENLTSTQRTLVPNSVKDTLKAAEATLKIVELPASSEITPNSRPNIVSTRAAYENLTDDQKAKVAKSTLDTLIAAEASLTIVELPASSEITPNSRSAIEAARRAYDALDEEQKAKVAKSVLDKLVAAETTLAISELPKTTGISTDSKEDIEAAKAAYDELSEEQKALVPQEIVDTLLTSEAVLNIVELPIARDITADSKKDIEAARAAYDELSDEQKANVPSSKLEKLTSSEATLSIVELPVVGDLTFEDKEAVLEAKNAYESLTPGAKEIVPFTAYNKLEDALVEINDIEAAKDVSDMINDLPDISKITREDILDVNTSRDSYEELSDYQQGKVSAETLNKLEKIEEIYNSMDKIDSIGTVAYKEESKALIDDAKEYFDSLDSDQIKAIDNVDKLNKAFNDYYAVDDTVNKADSITNIRHDTRSDDSIKAAREKYESLSSNQKALLPKESLQKIVDGEAVYDALEKIYGIGNAEYTVESESMIIEARESYNSLTPEQKALVNEEDVKVLESAESSYVNKENSANVVFTVFIIIVVILLALGAPLLVLMVLTQLKAKKGLKTMSVTFVPAILATSHYLDSRFIALYLLAVLLIGVIIAITVIAIKNPNVFKDILKLFKKEEKMEMALATAASPAVQPIPTPVLEQAPQESEEEETIVVTDKEGNIFQIRFNKSFTAKLIQANDESKKYYEELKNYVLSYNKTTSRISWHYDSINSGRNPILKFAIRGKTLGVYFALDPEDYTDTKYKVEKVESKKYEDVPCLYRIKNDRRCEYAKDLIDTVMNNLGLVKGEEKHESYYYQYEENEPLIARGLIKELKVQVNKQAEETQAPSVNENSEDEEEVIIKQDNEGNIFQIRYIKSFTAKLSQAEQVVKDYYNELKNYALSYNKTTSRVSWHYDSINIGRKQAIKFAIRGKVLCLYYALDANDYADSKYKVEKVESKKYEDVPCLYRIKNDRRCEYAKDLIDTVMNNIPTEKGKESNEDFKVKYETTQALLEKGLIKELKTATTAKDTSIKSITVEKADELMSDEKAKASIQIETVKKTRIGSKEIINIDVLSNNFNDGDEVTIEALIEKKLVPSKTGYIKLLARGCLDKKLIVYVNDYSLQAVKMITLLGGQVKQVK